MNFGKDDGGHQRPIDGRDTLDQKIVASSSPYARERTSNQSSPSDEDDGAVSVVYDADVLCGRGKTSFNHAGNKRFRDLITLSIPDYDKAESRLEKSLVVHSIVEGVRSVGGRFLKADQAPGRWLELDDRACREKVGHAVRDAATISQTRRQKKKDQQSPMHPTTSYMPQRGPISRFAEMKMDTPDPASFHDFTFFSNFMSGPPTFSSSLGSQELLPSVSLVGGQPRAMSAPPIDLPEPDPIINQGLAGRTNQGTVASSTNQDQLPGEEDFMARIDEVLGPMPVNHRTDPLAEILELT